MSSAETTTTNPYASTCRHCNGNLSLSADTWYGPNFTTKCPANHGKGHEPNDR